LIPGESPEAVRQELIDLISDLDSIEMDAPYVVSSGFEEPLDSPIFGKLEHCCSIHNSNLERIKASYATHAPFYRDLNIPTLVFGPGSIERAHTHGEYVELDQVEQVVNIVKSFLTAS